MNRNFVLLIFVLFLPNLFALSRNKQIYLCNKNPSLPQCSELREDFGDDSIEPPNKEQDEALREHFTLIDLAQKDLTTESIPITTTTALPPPSEEPEVDTTLTVEKKPLESAYKNDIVLWACFAGVGVIVMILLIIAHLFHLRHMKRELREWRERHESDQPRTAATQQPQNNLPSAPALPEQIAGKA